MGMLFRRVEFIGACVLLAVAGRAYAGVATYDFTNAPTPGAGAVQSGITFSGFTPGKTMTADSGADIAIVTSTESVVKPYPTYSLARACNFKYHHVFAHVSGNIPSGPVEIAYVGTPVKQNQFLNKALRFIITRRGDDVVQLFAVDTGGTILPYLFTENLAVQRVDPNLTPNLMADSAQVQFTPSVCRLTKTMVPVGTSIVRGSSRVIQYTGRDSRGYLTFSTVAKRDMGDPQLNVALKANHATIPAQPGVYRVFGLPINVISTGQYKVVYSIPVSAGNPAADSSSDAPSSSDNPW